MIQELKSFLEFRNLKASAWKLNSNDWIKSRYLPNLFTNYIINTLITYLEVRKYQRLIDVGCGNGWLINDIENSLKKKNSIEFIGLDDNELFIKYLNANLQKPNFKFDWTNIESQNSLNLKSSKPTIVTAILSLIETPDLEQSFKSISGMLKNNDIVLCVVLNPYMELIRLNKNYKELLFDLKRFRKQKLYYYSKKLVLNNDFESNYFGILHRIEDYIFKAQINSLYLKEFKEIDPINDLGDSSTVYKILIFEKR